MYAGSDAAKIAYAASYLEGPAREWFRLYVDENTGNISFQTWPRFVAALKAIFGDPDA